MEHDVKRVCLARCRRLVLDERKACNRAAGDMQHDKRCRVDGSRHRASGSMQFQECAQVGHEV